MESEFARFRGLALTLRQPWAHAIAHGEKRIENRSWRPSANVLGSTIAIHAGAKPRGRALAEVECLCRELHLDFGAVQYGGVVATARVADVLEREPPIASPHYLWWAGPLAWVLDDVRTIELVPCKGAQGIWRLPSAAEAQVRERASREAPRRV